MVMLILIHYPMHVALKLRSIIMLIVECDGRTNHKFKLPHHNAIDVDSNQ